MRETSGDKLLKQHMLLRSNPQKYLALTEEMIRENPMDPNGYVRRHRAWRRLGHLERALDDLNTSLKLSPHPLTYLDRGNLYRELTQYRNAIQDFNCVETIVPDEFVDLWGPLFRAASYAQLGNEEAALADCARLKDDHWTPGLLGAPGGNKQQVAAELRRIAATARLARGGSQPRRAHARSILPHVTSCALPARRCTTPD